MGRSGSIKKSSEEESSILSDQEQTTSLTLTFLQMEKDVPETGERVGDTCLHKEMH